MTATPHSPHISLSQVLSVKLTGPQSGHLYVAGSSDKWLSMGVAMVLMLRGLVRGAGVARLERELSIFPSSSRLKEGQKTNVSRTKFIFPSKKTSTSIKKDKINKDRS